MAKIGVGNTTNKRRLRHAIPCFETPDHAVLILIIHAKSTEKEP